MRNKIYSNSEAYDLAFSYRDYGSDSQAMLRWYKELTGRRSEPERILELACGPGRMLLALCSDESSGNGIDICEEMCQFARQLADASGKNVSIDSGDMTEFALSKEFDLIVTMLNSISHITGEELLGRHFVCVREHLAPGGLYLIEATRIRNPKRGSWKTIDDVEYATLEWVEWFNNRRLLGPIGNIPPAEYEQRYYDKIGESAMPASLKLSTLRFSRGDSISTVSAAFK